MSGHTPGPWGYELISGAIFYDDGDLEPLVAWTNFDSVSEEQGDADARLIAAAPDGLDFAVAFLAMIDRSDPDDLDFGRGLAASGLIEQARAFVARATGAA